MSRYHARAEIDLSAIEHNYKQVHQRLPSRCGVMGVVKADGYGHGAVRVAERLQTMGCTFLAVSSIDEALELRQGGLTLPILILGYTGPDCAAELLQNKLTQTVYNLPDLLAFAKAAGQAGGRLPVHIKVDTGMSRLGVRWDGEEFEQMLSELPTLKTIEAQGIFSHFASSDEPGEGFTQIQMNRFEQTLKRCAGKGVAFQYRHLANSGGIVHHPASHLNLVRAGLILYGYSLGPCDWDLRPAMRLTTCVSQVKQIAADDTVSYGRTFTAPREMTVAVLAVGYADGYPRILSGKADVVIHGRPAPILGRVCMDMLMVDVTGRTEVKEGDEACLFGDAGGLVDANTLAELAHTIPYEILCNISKRVPRLYI